MADLAPGRRRSPRRLRALPPAHGLLRSFLDAAARSGAPRHARASHRSHGSGSPLPPPRAAPRHHGRVPGAPAAGAGAGARRSRPVNVRAIVAWTLYDFANSSFAAVVFATIYAAYYAMA